MLHGALGVKGQKRRDTHLIRRVPSLLTLRAVVPGAWPIGSPAISATYFTTTVLNWPEMQQPFLAAAGTVFLSQHFPFGPWIVLGFTKVHAVQSLFL